MLGVDILLYVNTGTDAAPVWTKVGGQRGATLSESNEMIDTSSKDTPKNKTYEYGLGDWTIGCDGVYVVDETGYEKLKSASRNKEKIKVRMKETGGTGSNADEGMALISSRELDAPYDDTATYSVELQGSGEITAVTMP